MIRIFFVQHPRRPGDVREPLVVARNRRELVELSAKGAVGSRTFSWEEANLVRAIAAHVEKMPKEPEVDAFGNAAIYNVVERDGST